MTNSTHNESLTKTIDFVNNLPFEIFTRIFSQLSTEQIILCLTVCQNWRNQLISCHVLWETIELNNASHARLFKILNSLSNRVKRLTIYDNGDNEKAFQWLATCHFEALRTLVIDMECSSDDFYRLHLCPGLQNVGLFLDHITLVNVDAKQLSIQRVLQFCPNISHLKYNGYNLSTLFEENHHETERTKDSGHRLTHIFIHMDGHLNPYDIRYTLKNTPHLQQLLISYCAPDILDIIFDCCPDLPYLNYNSAVTQEDNQVHMEFVNDNNYQGRGMQFLKLANYHLPITSEQIKRFFIHNNTTLKAFEFSNSFSIQEQSVPDFSSIFSTIQQDNSNILRQFHCNTSISIETMALIITHCTHLEDLKFSKVDLACLELIMTSVPRLQKLHLVECHNMNEQDWKTLVLDDCPSLTDAGLYHLGHISNLDTVSIRSCNDLITEVGIEQCIKEMDTLQCIELIRLECVSDHVLFTLGQSNAKLKTVYLQELDHVTLKGVQDLVRHAPTVHHLHVVECGDITLNGLKTVCSAGITLCTKKLLSL
ncbi:hypothetical protein BDA99DRAFT_541659 [Phascolomyces articulosus]|uniref:F-box domain-containing protein n=1 Tax=Phascolomyces articulosus TaxID=60185 RepID=A0AAD5JRK1_9FUNG|nr:hypothetical protein BDA99DRAFT_541659 [Phascolomyces articulosus]